jgi:Ca2+-binding EF-hand superfamily protein
MRILFREFDADKDGFVSREELKQKIASYSLLEGWEVENLASYFD